MSAELEAIYVALQYISRNGIMNAVIMTDSKSGCEFILNQMDKDERDETTDKILNMASTYKTTIQWIPGHTGVQGNEMADRLAKAGLDQDNICNNKIFIHDAWNYFERLSEEGAQQWYLEYTSELGKGRKFFQVQNTIPNKPWHYKLELNNTEIRTLNRLLSGHDFSRYWLYKMKLADDCICTICDVIDNAEHTLFFCVKYAVTRTKYNLDRYCNIYQVLEAKDTTLLRNVVNFLKEIKSNI